MTLISCQILKRNLAPLAIIVPGHEGARRLVRASVPSCHRSLQVLYYLAYESEPQKLARAHVTGNSPRRYVLLLALICTHVYRNTKHSFDWPHHNRAVQCSDRFCRVKLLRQHLKEYLLSLDNNSIHHCPPHETPPCFLSGKHHIAWQEDEKKAGPCKTWNVKSSWTAVFAQKLHSTLCLFMEWWKDLLNKGIGCLI